jgi:hypothetical protein
LRWAWHRQAKLIAYREFLLGRVNARHDITMPELAADLVSAIGTQTDPSSLSCRLIRNYRSKNAAGQRTRTLRLLRDQTVAPIHTTDSRPSRILLLDLPDGIVGVLLRPTDRLGRPSMQLRQSRTEEVVAHPCRIRGGSHTSTAENRRTINLVGFKSLPLPSDIPAKCRGCRRQKRFKISRLQVPY